MLVLLLLATQQLKIPDSLNDYFCGCQNIALFPLRQIGRHFGFWRPY